MAENWNVSIMDLQVHYENDLPVVEATGECDLITSRKLRELIDDLIDTGHHRIIFDFHAMTYIDSSGFSTLLDAKHKVVEHGGDIALVSLTAPVERVFNLLALGDVFIRTHTLEEAMARMLTITCH